MLVVVFMYLYTYIYDIYIWWYLNQPCETCERQHVPTDSSVCFVSTGHFDLADLDDFQYYTIQEEGKEDIYHIPTPRCTHYTYIKDV